MNENQDNKIFLDLQEEGKNDFELKELEQLALKHHMDNFNEIVNKCNKSFECIKNNVNLFIESMDKFVEQINEEKQEKKKLQKNR